VKVRGKGSAAMSKARSAGFTLVEILVVISVIGVLIGLTLPAVNAARESGRRTKCSNNIKQIGLALYQYLDAHQRFPPGTTLEPYFPKLEAFYDPWEEAAGDVSGKRGYSWMIFILPFIEQNRIYKSWDFSKSVIGNADLAQSDIKMFYCPSRRAGIRPGDDKIMFQNWRSGGTDYGGCIGRGNSWCNDYSSSFTSPKISHEFVYGTTLFKYVEYIGIFAANFAASPTDIRDGMSKTIMVGEMQRLHPLSNTTGYDKYNRTSNDGWATAGVATLFDTMIKDEGGDHGAPGGFNNWFFESAGSEHPNGANFGFADGTVHFLDEKIDPHIYSYMGSMADHQIIETPE
jgi:prepilin-type N-terminal cleavage/methylation domain-containing protein/prepilin-type processing-associated H-X9-DG protein